MSWLPKPHRPSLTDEQAMRDVQLRGDHEAFAQLVQRWETPIRRLCIRMTFDEHRSEDLAQEAFARVFAKRLQFEHGRKFSTWLWRIALNLCFEEGRRAARLPLDDDSTASGLSSSGPQADEQVIAQERAEQVKRALARLSDANRCVVVLREYEGLKYREIAEALEIPEGTVKWRMAEALDQLARELRPLAPNEDRPQRLAPIL